MPELRLSGCRSRPLLGYLKALGLLRVVSQQIDRSTRGRWRDGVFELHSKLDDAQLSSFLLEAYMPSPVVSPWNGGSGFDRADRKQYEMILMLERSVDPRFTAYRETIQTARVALDRLEITEKLESMKEAEQRGELSRKQATKERQRLRNETKQPLVRELRRTLPDAALSWLDAAIVITGEQVSYPPLLGSGGNDGRYDFSNNYAQAVVHCLLSGKHEDAAVSLSAAIAGGAVELQRKLSLGHLSRDSSPTNSPYGEADSLGNHWDLILAVEGTLLLVAGAARRHGAAISGTLVAPFTVYSTAAGYGSAADGEAGRAELWLPLWPGWATAAEISNLARESRAQVGRGTARRQARTGLDFARAAGSLGVARGIEAFERYAILERAGQSSLAVPAGRVSVSERPSAKAVQSIGPWLDAVLRFGNRDTCPSAIQVAIHRLERTAFQLASHGSPQDACATLEAMGAVEHALAGSRSAIEAGMRPLRRVRAAAWLAAAHDGTAAFEVAAALASLHDRRPTLPALRDYLHGTRQDKGGATFDVERRHVVNGNGLAQLLAAVHARRHLDAARSPADDVDDGVSRSTEPDRSRDDTNAATAGLAFDYGMWCDLRTARMFVARQLDEGRILRLLRGLVLLDYYQDTLPGGAPVVACMPHPTFEALALAWMGRPVRQGVDMEREHLGPRPGWAARLAAGAVASVVADARLRLQMAGLPLTPTENDLLAGVSSSARLGPRLGAALLLRLGPSDLEQIAHRLVIPNHVDNDKNNQRKEVA